MAGVKTWIWSNEIKSGVLTVNDRFELDEVKSENIINFLTWGDVVIKDGKVEISVNGVKAQVKYDNRKFDVKKESVKLTDKKLSNVWGDEIYRLSFIAKDKKIKDSYIFKIIY